MKRIGSLWPEVLASDNLLRVSRKVRGRQSDQQGTLIPGAGRQGRRSREFFLVKFRYCLRRWVALAVMFFATTALAAESPSPVEPPTTLDALPCEDSPTPEMVLIAAGYFDMGSPPAESGSTEDERPRHAVAIVQPFALSRCEISVGQFRRFVDETSYVTDAERGKGCYAINKAGDNWEQGTDRHWRAPGFVQDDNHPVVCVSWNDAQAYARWLSARTGQRYRLPSEAEWEYAARAGGQTSRFWGDDPDQACAYANGADQSMQQRFPDWTGIHNCEDGAVFTQTRGRYRRNTFGLADMLGNVWEWTQDCWHNNYAGAPVDGSAWKTQNGRDCARRVVRGGGWLNRPRYLRSANRGRGSPDGANIDRGFRLARTL